MDDTGQPAHVEGRGPAPIATPVDVVKQVLGMKSVEQQTLDVLREIRDGINKLVARTIEKSATSYTAKPTETIKVDATAVVEQTRAEKKGGRR